MEKSKGYYLTVEGLDGAGKTTAIAYLAQSLRNHGADVVLVREPGGTELAEELRTIIKKPRDFKVGAITELFLFSAARRDLYDREVLPALERGDVVISDRSIITMLAYQGVGHGQLEEVKKVIPILYPNDTPIDLCLTLDVDEIEGLRRARQRATETNTACRIEQEPIEFFRKARGAFKDQNVIGLVAKKLLVWNTSQVPLEASHSFYDDVVKHVIDQLME